MPIFKNEELKHLISEIADERAKFAQLKKHNLSEYPNKTHIYAKTRKFSEPQALFHFEQ